MCTTKRMRMRMRLRMWKRIQIQMWSWTELPVYPHADSTSIGYNNQKGKKYWRNISTSFLVRVSYANLLLCLSLFQSSAISSVNVGHWQFDRPWKSICNASNRIPIIGLWCVYTIFKLYCCCRSLPFCHSLFCFIVPTIWDGCFFLVFVYCVLGSA